MIFLKKLPLLCFICFIEIVIAQKNVIQTILHINILGKQRQYEVKKIWS
jgi:hypothetical protein